MARRKKCRFGLKKGTNRCRKTRRPRRKRGLFGAARRRRRRR